MTQNSTIDLNHPSLYNNRELSLISFNERVLMEAVEPSNPLLEQLKFIAIFSSNTDEFFMVRVAGLLDQIKANYTKPDNKAGLKPIEQVESISKNMTRLSKEQYRIYHDLTRKLQDYGCRIIHKAKDLDSLEQYFDEFLFPNLTPIVIDEHQPFPLLSNKAVYIGVELKSEINKTISAFLKVPDMLPRFVFSSELDAYVFIEDIISHFAYKLFDGYSVYSVTMFRITRNADLTIHEEGARDLLEEIEKELQNREEGAVVRLEVDQNPSHSLLEMLKRKFHVLERDVYYQNGPLDLTFLFQFWEEKSKENPSLAYPTFRPQQPMYLEKNESIFSTAREKDLFFHHPYDSFDPVVSFVTEAAEDDQVLAIKQTLYRVSENSPIIQALKKAAENGKDVTVLVELKARFDEENNVQWARSLEKAGCHVIYGVPFLKTHSKIILVVRRQGETIERFVHLGTGNYNDQTASLYTDMGIITSRHEFGEDATRFFNYLADNSSKNEFRHFSVAPVHLKNDLISYIQQEVINHKKHNNGRIIAKMNSLTEKSIIKEFYKASQQGVQIDLIVRGICCLRPGIPGVSENIKVRSIIGRFLEHSRIFYFYNNGDARYFLSSADLMTRNVKRRIELMVPIYENSVQQAIWDVLDLQLMDDKKARVLDRYGNYTSLTNRSVNSQLELLKLAYERNGATFE
ncbi:polyphosphate kinase [Alkalibacillus flavidus]|uniref:Polyphosphate kinase n=1 Tax=Alkalibacillus flavidus TaxID=546021 RepID=A0ABV2KWV1_9BACI